MKLGELYTTHDESLVEAAKGILIDLMEAADWTGFSCEGLHHTDRKAGLFLRTHPAL